jgi:hypothetical protein
MLAKHFVLLREMQVFPQALPAEQIFQQARGGRVDRAFAGERSEQPVCLLVGVGRNVG